MRYIIVIFIILTIARPAHAECVVLLHGLGRTAQSMEKLRARLGEEGYNTVNYDYPSRKYPIEKLAETVIPDALSLCRDDAQVSFVTHSLGGILVRQYLANHKIPNLHRVVMLGPPNKGSEVVDALKNFPGFHLINGDAGGQLGTDTQSVPGRLGKADFDLGIIAGTTTINLILSMIIPGVDDGKVSVARTRLDGMADHIEMIGSHPFLMKDDKIIEQVVHYLVNGHFNRTAAVVEPTHISMGD